MAWFLISYGIAVILVAAMLYPPLGAILGAVFGTVYFGCVVHSAFQGFRERRYNRRVSSG